ncbi:hypothetical protein [Rhodoblastus acidophilus]|uniref:hypothetical protein n=1 Tax=Rhodoblastus acidophilus TaxID=1074 RepID=UPI003CD022EF
MPQASDELRSKMQTYFGDEIDDGGPMRFLEEHGYVIQRTGVISCPVGREITDKEWDCICFLCDEWDYGYNG